MSLLDLEARLSEELEAITLGEPWKTLVLDLMSDAVGNFGYPKGVRLAEGIVNNLLGEGGGEVPEWTSLYFESEFLALLQNEEADHKAAAQEFLAQVGQILGQVLKGMAQTLIPG